MSKKTNYNSIVFLTTLSVYLGLVLVGGATPQVLAQAALTRDFDIKNEFEFKDDLDNKPDDEEIEELQKLDLAAPLLTFIDDLRKLASIGKYDLTGEIRTKAVYKGNFPNISYYNEQTNKWHSTAAVDAIEKIYASTQFWSDFIDEAESDGKDNRQTISVIVNSGGLELKVSLRKDSKETATQLAENLNRVFKVKLNQSKTVSNKQIYENTKVTFENNQVFIVTNLPRASIDELLSKVAQ